MTIVSTEIVEFQSTLPARGATQQLRQSYQALQFQSTLPARGATAISHKKSTLLLCV